MRGKKVSEEIKAKIIEESLLEDCVVSDLAKRHSIASETIYTWRSAYRKLHSVDNSGRFVELSVQESKHVHLQEATLKFANFQVSIQGQIKSAVLLSIVKTLEEVC